MLPLELDAIDVHSMEMTCNQQTLTEWMVPSSEMVFCTRNFDSIGSVKRYFASHLLCYQFEYYYYCYRIVVFPTVSQVALGMHSNACTVIVLCLFYHTAIGKQDQNVEATVHASTKHKQKSVRIKIGIRRVNCPALLPNEPRTINENEKKIINFA